MKAPTNNVEALTLALILSATAPDEQRSRKALDLAGQLAARMSAREIASAKDGAQIVLYAGDSSIQGGKDV
jgi:hypothetical protein